MDPVERQYSRWVYPKPIDDLQAAIAAGYNEVGNPARYAPLVWPDRDPAVPARILIAGCGANQAAYFALTNPQSEVVGIDLSAPSLAHQQQLALRHGLSNLHLQKRSILDVAELGEPFDLIVSTGVLHHMPDPAAGLAALRAILKPGGAMSLSVYGKHRRNGIYMLQDVFRRMKLDQSAESVAIVRAMLAALPPFHPVQFAISNSPDLQHDAGIVDLFLHPQDIGFSVDEIFVWLEQQGLVFQCWHDQAKYATRFAIPAAAPYSDSITTLSERDQFAIMELIAPTMFLHAFIARPRELPSDAYQIEFETDRFLRFIPHPRPEASLTAPPPNVQNLARILSRPGVQLGLAQGELLVFEAMDGRRSIGDIVRLLEVHGIAPQQAADFARGFFSRLWDAAFVMFGIAHARA